MESPALAGTTIGSMGPSSLWICQAARASYLVFQGWRNSTAGCKRTRIREEFPKPGCFALQSGRAFYLALCIASWPSLAGSEDLDCTGALDMAQMKAVKSGPGTQSSWGTRGWFTQLPLCYLCTPPGLSRDLEPVTDITRKRAESLARLGSSEPEFR